MPTPAGPPHGSTSGIEDSMITEKDCEQNHYDVGDTFYDISPYTFQETGLYSQLAQRFITDNPGDMFFERREFALSKYSNSTYSIAAKLKSVLSDARAVMPFNDAIIAITGKFKETPIFIWVGLTHTTETIDIKVDCLGNAAKAMADYVDASFNDERLAIIKWWHMGRHGEGNKDFYLNDDGSVLHPEFYPDLPDPAQYLREYLESNEAILLIAGPPGTGKTTLLRRLIMDHKLIAHVVYDETLMKNDAIFQSFLFEERKAGQGDIMIIEDADTILSAREDDGNKLMSRFLNVSDGLIKLPNKKLVFTTNIMDFNRVDQALLRPGRCFGVMHTRALNLTEAQAAARVANLPVPSEKREYTLAELFNRRNNFKLRTVGFGARH